MHLFVSFVLVLLLVKQIAANPVKITVRLQEVKDAPESTEDCTACAQLKEALEQTPSPEEIQQARIEHIKKMILQKLRLIGRPNVTQPLKRLPEPLLQKHGGLYEQTGDWKGDRTEPYYAETREVISFAESGENSVVSVESSHTSTG